MVQRAMQFVRVTYVKGERVLTRSGWGVVINIKEEKFPPPNDGIVTYECTVKLDKPLNQGESEVKERNPRKDYRYMVLCNFWNAGEPKSQGSLTVEEFLPNEEAQAREVFESTDRTSGQVLTVVFIDYETGKAETRILNADGEVARHPK